MMEKNDTSYVFIVDEGTYLGRLKATGIRPSFSDHLENMGVPLPADLFAPEPFAKR